MLHQPLKMLLSIVDVISMISSLENEPSICSRLNEFLIEKGDAVAKLGLVAFLLAGSAIVVKGETIDQSEAEVRAIRALLMADYSKHGLLDKLEITQAQIEEAGVDINDSMILTSDRVKDNYAFFSENRPEKSDFKEFNQWINLQHGSRRLVQDVLANNQAKSAEFEMSKKCLGSALSSDMKPANQEEGQKILKIEKALRDLYGVDMVIAPNNQDLPKTIRSIGDMCLEYTTDKLDLTEQ